MAYFDILTRVSGYEYYESDMKLQKILRNQKGFTLVELLVVIAVLGVLAAAVLVAINPPEQLARGRDSGRVSAVTELGRGLTRYNTSQGKYPSIGAWMPELTSSSEVKTAPVNPDGSICTINVSGNYCYSLSGSGATESVIVYAQAESSTYKKKATSCATKTWIVYTSELGKTGLVCSATEPSAPVSTVIAL